MNEQPAGNQQINIELGEKEAEGIYSNLAIITHSPAEFIIDFTRVLPGVPKAKVHARLMLMFRDLFHWLVKKDMQKLYSITEIAILSLRFAEEFASMYARANADAQNWTVQFPFAA